MFFFLGSLVAKSFFFSREVQEACVAAKSGRGGGCRNSGGLKSYILLQLLPGHPAGCL